MNEKSYPLQLMATVILSNILNSGLNPYEVTRDYPQNGHKRTQTNGPEDKRVDDDASIFTSKV